MSVGAANPCSLTGRVAVVTGGGGGLGEGMCLALAAAGARVAVVGRTVDKLERVANLVTAAGGEAMAATVDVADAASVAAMTERVTVAWGGSDILVNNAAVYHRKAWTELSEADWDETLDTNLNEL